MRLDRLLLASALALYLAAGARDGIDRWVAATVLPPLAAETSVEVLDRDGGLLRAYTVADGRWRLAAGAVDPRYLRMLVAYEDRRFYTHAGVDPLAVLRAGWQAARAGRVVSGASTLTMQVARLLEEGPTGSWAGKLRQLRVALALERRLDKAQILALYLDHAPFGGNIEGVRAASLAWFGKPPARLTDAEAALLVALPQAPAARRPDRHPQAARAARDRVVLRMRAEGVLGAEAAAAALAAPLPAARRPLPTLAPHLADRLRAADPGAAVIRTTLDGAAQARMEALARQAVTGRDARLSVAIVAADHATGAILAHVGAPAQAADRRGFVDMTRALRSPGSTLKPLVYALAFDAGIAHPETLIADRPGDFGGWRPQNFDGNYRGELRVAEALRQSLNLPTVQLAQALGPARLMAALDRAGVETALPGDGPPGLAVSLGGLGVTLEGLVTLHAGLARGGAAVTLRATDAPPRPGPRITGPEAAWQVGNILRDLAPPPGAPARRIAWKTGTSYGHRDTWAIGWDGAHVIGVWMGRPDGTPVPGAFGAELAAPVLFDAFARLAPRPAPLPPPPPGTLLLSNAALPAPLRRFGPAAAAADAPGIAFPPDGARLVPAGGLAAKVSDGTPPFTWLANGTPVATRTHERESWLPIQGPGFITLSVIDSTGQAARSRIRLD
jgi:penicillin-binding protein 1C